MATLELGFFSMFLIPCTNSKTINSREGSREMQRNSVMVQLSYQLQQYSVEELEKISRLDVALIL